MQTSRRLRSNQVTSVISVLILLIIVLFSIYEVVLSIKNRSATAASGGVDCTVKPSSEIITYFYKSSTPAQQRDELARRIHGVVRDQYPALHGTSLLVPVTQYQNDLNMVRHSSFVISAGGSENQGCQDPD